MQVLVLIRFMPTFQSMEIKKATSFFTPHSPVNFIFFILQLLWPCCKISLSRAACSSDPWTRKSWASAGSRSTAGRAGSAVPAPGQLPRDSLTGHQDSKTNPNAGVLGHTLAMFCCSTDTFLQPTLEKLLIWLGDTYKYYFFLEERAEKWIGIKVL